MSIQKSINSWQVPLLHCHLGKELQKIGGTTTLLECLSSLWNLITKKESFPENTDTEMELMKKIMFYKNILMPSICKDGFGLT